MKTYKKLIEELMETSPVNSMGGGFSVGQASSNSGNLAGYDPVMGMHRRKKKRRGLGLGETFAGCPVFEVSSDDFTKCSHGRNKYERWGNKMNMEEADNQDIRAYAHRNPGKPIIIKDSTYGTMSYLIPRQNVTESFELDEKFTISGYNKKGKKIGGYTALGQRDADSAAKTLKTHFGAHKVEIESSGKNTKTESFELDEGKMSEIDARRKEGQSPEQIAKGMKVDVKDVKKILGIRKTRPLTNPMYSSESVPKK